MNNILILQKDLPFCPKGSKFKINTSGGYFNSMTDEEAISGKFKNYSFSKEEIEELPEWFGVEKKCPNGGMVNIKHIRN